MLMPTVKFKFVTDVNNAVRSTYVLTLRTAAITKILGGQG